MNDCRACTVATEASALRSLGRHEEALEVAVDLLAEKMGCAHQPRSALAAAMASARACNRPDAAQDYHRRGLDMIGTNVDYTASLGRHLRHMAVSGMAPEALALLEKTLPHVYGDDGDLLQYHRGARLTVAALERAGLEPEAVERLRPDVEGRAEALAAAFDARNGTTYNAEDLAADDAELAGAQ